MNFSFELLDVTCNAVLSSHDSPWGAFDGVRVYFLALTGSNQRVLLISGREFPEPDIADNYYFFPGKKIDLRSFPPQNAPSWDTGLLDVNEGDNVWCAVIGINEGLPYIAGGGGGFTGKLGEAGVKTFLTGAHIPVSLDLLNVALEQINQASDCRGVAFAYELVFSARYLFATHFKQPRTRLTLNEGNSSQGLQIISRPKQGSGCGTPNYEVNLAINLHDQPMVAVDERVTQVRNGIPRRFEPRFTLCVDPDRPIEVWPVLFTREITLSTKNFFLPTITIWQLDGQTISAPSGAFTLNKEVTFPVDGTRVSRSVTVGFSVSAVGGTDKLVLTNEPDDGNYSVRVTLLLKFFDNQPPLVFYDDDIEIVGQGVNGNQAYWDYINCLEHFRQTLGKYARRHMWIAPGTPVEQVVRLERDMLELADVLTGKRSLPIVRPSS